MRAYVFTDKSLERYAGQFVWLSIDTEDAKNTAFLKAHPISVWPTLLVLDPKDKVVLRYAGGGTVPQIRKLLDANDPSHLKLRTPLRIEQGTSDTTVIPLFTDQLATELKANGDKSLTYNKVTGVDHAGITAGTGATDATKYLKKLLKP